MRLSGCYRLPLAASSLEIAREQQASRNSRWDRGTGRGRCWQGPRAEIGTVQGSTIFVNLSNEGLITLAPHLVRVWEIGEVALCARPSIESARCSASTNPIGVWCNKPVRGVIDHSQLPSDLSHPEHMNEDHPSTCLNICTALSCSQKAH